MHTAIGQSLSSSRGRLAAASTIAALVVAADLALVWWNCFPLSTEGSYVLALIALVANVWLVQGDLASLGIRLTPLQGWWYWIRVSSLIGLIVAASIVVGLGILVLTGHNLPVYATSPGHFGAAFLSMCVFAPVVEETIYRLTVCIPLAVLIGPWKAIVVSGLAFGSVHQVAGIPSPENLIGGFFLAWAYLKSESIVVPVVLHALGNLCALALQIAAWHWLRGG
ncbi:MAG: CPBP family intramembrane metalloprotease [Planctomycetes bacterium]|nr:CPBP family intramembrane metalloprotease [Planctomycetota bacterium]